MFLNTLLKPSPIILITKPYQLFSTAFSKAMKSVEFEVHGKVQGVFFRKYTLAEANKLGLRGWCKNTAEGTVLGVIEGDDWSIRKMKSWLQETGSPSSRIDKAVFRNETNISDFTFKEFNITH